MKSTITNAGGELRSCVGPDAVEAFKLRALITMINFRIKTGFDIDRRVPTLKTARRITGLRSRNLADHRAAVVELLAAAVAKCEIVTE